MIHATMIRSSLEDSPMTLSLVRVNFTANSNGNIANGVAERERVGKIHNFQPISQFSANISETVKDRTVTVVTFSSSLIAIA